jgi:hypothetical protein
VFFWGLTVLVGIKTPKRRGKKIIMVVEESANKKSENGHHSASDL